MSLEFTETETELETEIETIESTCSICGDPHIYSECTYLSIKKSVTDNIIPTKAQLTLPDVLKLEKMADGTYMVKVNEIIHKGTQFGPYDAKKVFTINPQIIFPLKLFNQCDFFEQYYLDTSDENNCNWMYYVSPANNAEEQNLICFQENSNIYYASIKDIEPGEFLKVWYAPYYAKKMNKNVLISVENVADSEASTDFDLNSILKKQQKIVDRDIWTCKFCGKIENNIIKFAKHIIEHYVKQMKKCCELCNKGFNSRKGLLKHLRIVHSTKSFKITENTSNIPTVTNDKIYTRDSLVGGPLLNNISTDSLDNTNLLLHQTELNHFDMSNIENQNMLSETDNLNLENLLSESGKDLDHFNFEIYESQEQFVCDICLKNFTKLSSLVGHLRRHTGEYICRHCLRIFGRKENLEAHICEKNNKIPKYKCNLCQKTFSQGKYLSRHMNMTHFKKYSCDKCEKIYATLKELNEHNCSKIPDEVKKMYSCNVCDKAFYREVYLKKHLKIHEPTYIERLKIKKVVCEVCANTFESTKSLQQHLKTHFEPKLTCKVCDKKFHRQSILDNHLLIHGPAQATCDICSRRFKSPKYLNAHKLIHLGQKPYKCSQCSKDFFQKSNLQCHLKLMHNKFCFTCNREFSTAELYTRHKVIHTKNRICYTCMYCLKMFAVRSSLYRHTRTLHPDKSIKIIEMSSDENAEINDCEHVTDADNNDDEIEMLLQQKSSSLNDAAQDIEESNLHAKHIESLLDFNDIDIDFNEQPNLNNTEVCLSMPDLYENDQDITLNEDAYVMGNGNIINPNESGKVTLYLLNQ